ncbi:11S globulin subunit beta-like [Hibiscus syriacus]|uniref:11S globulin subunit beta-like n=1 Tax=Hibiscus syriacus TaxID=106335 RepID=A0A6A3BVR7_HIBSY|nr:11S globulin subunit beta-like [Hibiscus syriacus]
MASIPSHALRHFTLTRPWLRKIRCTTSLASSSEEPHQILPHNTDTAAKNSNNSKSQAFFPKKNQILELECESLAFKGKGVCKVADSGFVCCVTMHFLENVSLAVLVDVLSVNIQVTKLKTLSPHWDFVDAPCEYASYCGGCKTQNLSYEAQLRAKEQQVRELVIHVGKFSDKNPDFSHIMKPIVPCDTQFHYRNKSSGSYGDFCHLLSFGKYSIVLDMDMRTGLPELMVNFVTSSYKPEMLKPLVEKISTIPEVAEVLYKLIEDCAGLRGDSSEIVLDLFCGTGTIGLTLAKIVAQAVADANKNAKLNGINNTTFVQGDLNKIDENFGKHFPKPDIVISDPNRPGMHMKLIKFLLKLKAPKIVYVSCNPATCARDIDYLCHVVEQKIKGCYKLKSIQPVDMFPHTPHIECVCLLELC